MTTATASGYDELPALLARLTGDEKHDTSAYSTLDVLWVLYDRVLETTRATASCSPRVTARWPTTRCWRRKGCFPADWLDDFGAFDSPLGYHPDRALVPGVEISSGSLGHGLPIAVGVARSRGGALYVLVGDGELDEGSNWEAIQYAGRVGLDRLTVVAVDNSSATHGWPGGIEARFRVEGWDGGARRRTRP